MRHAEFCKVVIEVVRGWDGAPGKENIHLGGVAPWRRTEDNSNSMMEMRLLKDQKKVRDPAAVFTANMVFDVMIKRKDEGEENNGRRQRIKRGICIWENM